MNTSTLMKRLGAGAVAAAVAAAVLASMPAEAKKPAKPAPGKPCTKEGATYEVRPGQMLICQRNAKGKLVWARQSGPGPGPNPGPTPGGQIPAVIETWGVSTSPYDAATKKSGDIYVGPLSESIIGVLAGPVVYYGGGPRRPTDPSNFIDPQMTFIVPKGTKVHSIVSGTVCSVQRIPVTYSNDYSIGIGVSVNGQPACQTDPNTGSGFGTIATWEHEHVMSPVVKQGDKVVAGQVIAEASWYTEQSQLYLNDLALYEIGILTQTSDGRPQHLCPALYLKPSLKDALLADVAVAARAYESNVGRTVYDANTLKTGCITEKPSEA